jgi:heme/copper-type cytochrome/quinol oxidase subunit 2
MSNNSNILQKLPVFSVGIIIAIIISGTIVIIVAMLIVSCHVVNRRRKKGRLSEGIELQ